MLYIYCCFPLIKFQSLTGRQWPAKRYNRNLKKKWHITEMDGFVTKKEKLKTNKQKKKQKKKKT